MDGKKLLNFIMIILEWYLKAQKYKSIHGEGLKILIPKQML